MTAIVKLGSDFKDKADIWMAIAGQVAFCAESAEMARRSLFRVISWMRSWVTFNNGYSDRGYLRELHEWSCDRVSLIGRSDLGKLCKFVKSDVAEPSSTHSIWQVELMNYLDLRNSRRRFRVLECEYRIRANDIPIRRNGTRLFFQWRLWRTDWGRSSLLRNRHLENAEITIRITMYDCD
jgi:hypothetical protein